MNKLKFFILHSSLFIVLGPSCCSPRAIVLGLVHSNAPAAPTLPNFIQQVAGWGTSFNTNYSWTPVTLQIEDGYKQATGSGASDYLRVQYDLGKFNVGVEGEFLGIGSQFTAGEFEAGYTLFSKYDFKIEANLLAGYDRGVKAAEIEPELKITKLITANTYATAGFSLPWFSKGAFNSSGQFRVGAGFTF